jgi:hypothetical protein
MTLKVSTRGGSRYAEQTQDAKLNTKQASEAKIAETQKS